MKLFFKRAVIILMCMTVFAGSAYLYLRYDQLNRQTDLEQSLVPYSSVPESAAILLNLPHGRFWLHLDFESLTLTVKNQIPDEFTDDEYFTVSADERLTAGMIDRVGGIELLTDGELLRFTGHQVTELLNSSVDPTELRNAAIKEYLKKAGEVGISRQDLVFMIENSETDLTVPDCFYWPEYTAELCRNCKFDF